MSEEYDFIEMMTEKARLNNLQDRLHYDVGHQEPPDNTHFYRWFRFPTDDINILNMQKYFHPSVVIVIRPMEAICYDVLRLFDVESV